jgi:ABC-2 type transport system permease protein
MLFPAPTSKPGYDTTFAAVWLARSPFCNTALGPLIPHRLRSIIFFLSIGEMGACVTPGLMAAAAARETIACTGGWYSTQEWSGIPMRLFWELVKISFQRYLSYRAAALAGLATNFFFGLLRAAVLTALYGARQEVAGISLQGAVTYTGLTQALIVFLSLFGWYELMYSVHSGDVSSDLLKPMNYYGFWLAQDCGRAIAGLLMRGLPIMLAYALMFGITLPRGVVQWLALGAVLVLSWLLSFAWRFLLNLAAFWTPNALGFGRFGYALTWFLSGFVMPLRLFPTWFVRLCYLTPFPHMVNTIVEVYLGVVSGPALVQALLGQLLWVLILVAAGQLVLRAGVRQLVIQGG